MVLDSSKHVSPHFNVHCSFIYTTLHAHSFTTLHFYYTLTFICNFIPHELIVCDEKNPRCFNTKIKSLTPEKIKTYKVLCKSIGNNQQTEKLQSLQNRLKLGDSKHNYYSRLADKLLNVQSNSKSYWSILKIFWNNKKEPIILPFISWK